MNEFIPENTAANADAVVDAAPEGIATPTDTASTSETPAPETPPAEPTEPTETETQAFARRLKEKTAEAEKAATERFNKLCAKLGGTMPDGSPIQTVDDLEKALEYQEMQALAAEKSVPVEILQELTETKTTAQQALDKLSAYERKEALAAEATALSADPKWGDFYKAHEADITAVADRAKCDLNTAKLIVYDQLGPERVDADAIANKAIQEFIEGKRKDYKPVEGSGATPTQVVGTPKTYAEAREQAMAYLRSAKEQT